MKAEIIAVGTEILLGDILNTNAQYLSKELAQLGIEVYFQTVVGDNPKRLKDLSALSFFPIIKKNLPFLMILLYHLERAG